MLYGRAGSNFHLFDDSKYPIGTGFPGAVDFGRCGNGGYVSERCV